MGKIRVDKSRTSFENDFCEVDLKNPDLRTEVPMKSSANARERQRMRLLSHAFCRLKTTLPWVPPDTKLSKLDTLR